MEELQEQSYPEILRQELLSSWLSVSLNELINVLIVRRSRMETVVLTLLKLGIQDLVHFDFMVSRTIVTSFEASLGTHMTVYVNMSHISPFNRIRQHLRR